MNILVTGAKGFVGKNLCATLKNIREGKDRTRPELTIGEILEYDLVPILRFWMNTAGKRISYSILQGSIVRKIPKNLCRATSALQVHFLIP